MWWPVQDIREDRHDQCPALVVRIGREFRELRRKTTYPRWIRTLRSRDVGLPRILLRPTSRCQLRQFRHFSCVVGDTYVSRIWTRIDRCFKTAR